jgi:hypothetical protein
MSQFRSLKNDTKIRRQSRISFKKPPLVPKNKLWTEIRLRGDLKYVCRLNTHLTNEEVTERLRFQSSQRICCNSFVVQKQLRVPHISARDVYEKVVYDAVRRDQGSNKKQETQSPEPQKENKLLSKSEMQMLNVLIPRNRRKDNAKKVTHNKAANDEISKKILGESNYEDWYEVKRHDLTEKVPVGDDDDVKNIEIRLLINQIDKAFEFTEFEIENVEAEVSFLREIKIIVDTFNSQMKDVAEKKKEHKVVIFDGTKSQNLQFNLPNYQFENEKRERLNSNFKTMHMKRFIISDHLE